MGSIANEIELMEEVAGWLKNWAAKVPQEDNISEFIPHRNKLVTIKRKIDKVLMYLRFHRPDVAKAVEEKWRGLVDRALADFPNKSDLNETNILSSIGHASYLGDTLHDVSKMARKERKRRTVKLILYITSAFVTFLAALLTCLYYLGWLEQIRAFIYNILLPK